MRSMTIVTAILAFSVAAMAQMDEAGFRAAMKQAGPTNGAIGKKIAAKDASAAADAEKLSAAFGDVRKFWEARKAADAVEFAKTAGDQLGMVAKAVAAGQWDEAAAAQKKVGPNCMGCHTAHREKAADGSWTIK